MLKAVQVGKKYNFYEPLTNVAFSLNETALNMIKYVKEHGKEKAIKKLSDLYEVDEEKLIKDLENVIADIESCGLKISDFPDNIEKISYSPIIVELDISSKCNSDCIYCMASSRINDDLDLSKKQIIDLIDQFDSLHTWAITLSGGEPTLREDLFEIIEHCNDLKIKTTIFTNGINMDKVMAEKIAEYKYVNVQVSLDSCIAEHHDKHRGKKGCFEKTVNGIKNLLDQNIDVTVAMVVSPINYNDIEETVDYLYDMGIRDVRIGNVIMQGNATDFQKKLYLNEGQLKELGKKITEISEKYKGKMSISKSPHMVSFQAEVSDFKKPMHNCNIGKYCLYVDPKGLVYPCMFLSYPEFLLGDAKKEKIIDIWNNSEKIKELQKISYRDIEKCSNCDYGFLCTGGCKGSAYDKFGNLDAPDPIFCSYFGVEISEEEKKKYQKQ